MGCPGWVMGLCVFINALMIMWLGWQMDKLSTLLSVDEYMQPLIVIWREILVVIAIIFVVAACIFAADADDNDGGACDCCANCHCWFYGCASVDDCFIHNDESERRRERREMELAAAAERRISGDSAGVAESGEVVAGAAGAGVAAGAIAA